MHLSTHLSISKGWRGMSLSNIRNRNKKSDSFACAEINYNTLTSEDVKSIKDDAFCKLIKPVNYRTINKLKEQ